MGFNNNWVLSHKLASLVHIVSFYLLLFFCFVSKYIFRLRKCGGSLNKNNNNKDIILLEKSGADISEIRDNYAKEKLLKFKFPSFKELSRIHREKICHFLFNSQFVIEKIATFHIKKIVGFDGGQNVELTEDEDEDEDEDEFLFCCEEKNVNFLCDGDFDSENEQLTLESEFEFSGSENIVEPTSDFLSENDFENENNSEKINLELRNDANKLESFWEHQELIDQLRMELREVRVTGLPTILEESEEKPSEVDEKPDHEDRIVELRISYHGYTQMMRKFDILNYQKMYAIGFLELDDPFQPKSRKKPSAPKLKSIVSQSHWSFKHKSHIKKLVDQMQGELEAVYVGQMCLSWEFIRWQYDKALDLRNSDPSGVHQYNDVAGEFQQFRVLMERFVEDEPFQGPRVHSYGKSRCVLRNLLQVPLIREDYLKGKNKSRKKEGENDVTIEMLLEIVEESIQMFWRFVQSDKDHCNNSVSNKKLPELHNSQDLKLLLQVRKTLQKKEKKLKNILRSENCILRRFQENVENDGDQVLHFYAQVDMKLVSRVFNMSKITRDQLIWCGDKLSRINFVSRKIHVEPGFLLFPCN